MSNQPRFYEGPEYSYAKGELTLLAYLAFKRPKEERYKRLIPKDSEAWLEFQVQLIKRKRNFYFISEKDIRNTIRITRPHLGKKKNEKPAEPDPDLPDCHFWDEDQVGEWLSSVGFSHLKETFKNNCITGRKLVTVDASALNKMGLKYFSEIKEVAAKIREVLGVHSPNMMRAIMRRPPFIEYLNKCRFTGGTYEFLTFKKFCEANGFPYDVLKYNPCALIDFCCQLLIKEARAKMGTRSEFDYARHGSIRSSSSSSSGSSYTLEHAPSVEFTVRHMVVRNKVIKEIIDELLDQVTLPPHERKYGPDAIASRHRMRDILENGFDQLGLTDEELWARMDFAKEVADGLIDEVRKTQNVLQDIQAFKKMLNNESISLKEIEFMRDVATDFFDAVATVGALLAFGEFDLENIFRQEPEFEEFVDQVVDEAEFVLNERVSSADAFVRDVIEEARHRIMAKDLNIPLRDLRVVRSYAARLVDKMINLALTCVEGTTTRSQVDLSKDYMTQDDFSYFNQSDADPEYSSASSSAREYWSNDADVYTLDSIRRESGSSGSFQPGSKSLTDMRSSSSKSQIGSSKTKLRRPRPRSHPNRRGFLKSTTSAGGDTTAEAEEEYRTTTSEFTTMSSAGEGNLLSQLSSGEASSSDGQENQGTGSSTDVQGNRGTGSSTGGQENRGTGSSKGGQEKRASASSDPNKKRGSGSTDGKEKRSSASAARASGPDPDFYQLISSVRATRDSDPDPNFYKAVSSVRTKKRATDPGFDRAGMHRTDFVETWATGADESSPVADLGGGQLNQLEQARLIRITADQVVSNVLQRALLHLLRDVEVEAESGGRGAGAGSGLNVEQIMEALEQLKMESQKALQEDNRNPYNINNEILRLWTPTVLSRTLDMSTVQAGPSGIRTTEGATSIMEEVLSSGVRMPAPPGYRHPIVPPQGTQSRAHLYEKKKGKKKGGHRGGDRECDDGPCDTPEVVCSYPILIPAYRK